MKIITTVLLGSLLLTGCTPTPPVNQPTVTPPTTTPSITEEVTMPPFQVTEEESETQTSEVTESATEEQPNVQTPVSRSFAGVYSISDALLYNNAQYGFALTTGTDCKKQFSIKEEQSSDVPGTQLSVYVPQSKTWPKNSVWYFYNLLSQKEYDKISDEVPPGKPSILYKLDGGMLLAVYGPQDNPNDISNCKVRAVMMPTNTVDTSGN